MPKVAHKVIVDELTDDFYVTEGKIVGYDVVGHRGKKYHRNPAHNSRLGEGKCNLNKGFGAGRAQVARRLQITVIDFDDGRIDGQNHKGQEIVHHTDNRVDDIPRVGFVIGAQPNEKLLQGVDTQHEVDPHGDDEEEKEHGFIFQLAFCDDIRNGIGDKQADDRAH